MTDFDTKLAELKHLLADGKSTDMGKMLRLMADLIEALAPFSSAGEPYCKGHPEAAVEHCRDECGRKREAEGRCPVCDNFLPKD